MKLFYNACFYPMRAAGERPCAALLVEGERIKQVFVDIPAVLTRSPDVEKVDLGGCFVYPGFIDTHTHSFTGGLYTLACDLKGALSLDEVFSRLKAAVPLNGRIIAWQFDESELKEGRFPTRAELDRILPATPLLFRRVDGHSCLLNTAAMQAIPWTARPRPDSRGVLRGKDNGTATRFFHQVDEPAVIGAYHAAAAAAVRGGHTTVHTTIGDGAADLLHYPLIQSRLADFKIEFILYPQITDVERAAAVGAPRIGGCLLVDGSFGSRTAALHKPYHGRLFYRGRLNRPDAFWQEFVRAADARGMQVAVHAIGDRATEQIAAAYASAGHRTNSHLIIHNELVSERTIELMSRFGITALMQPLFDTLWGGPDGLYARVLGRTRALKTNRFRDLSVAGVLVAGGSDWYISELNAVKGIIAAMNTRNPAQRLSGYEAVALYTVNAARVSHDEQRLGMLAPGLKADMVCLDGDLIAEPPPSDHEQIKILRVIKRGQEIKAD